MDHHQARGGTRLADARSSRARRPAPARARVYSPRHVVRTRARGRPCAAAREAAAILREHYARDTKSWEKSEDNPVTAADLDSDRAIATPAARGLPGDALLSEETLSDPARLANPRVWIVDPMDGTKEFIQRIPEFGVSIALCERGEPVVGVIANPGAGRHALGHARRRLLPRRAPRRGLALRGPLGGGRDREPHRDLAQPVRSLRGLVQGDPAGGLDRLEARLHRLRRGRSQHLGRAQERVGRVRGRSAGARGRRRLPRLRRRRRASTTRPIR